MHLGLKLAYDLMGNVLARIAPYSPLSQQCPPASAFNPQRDIPDLTGKVAIVTGANSGVGFYTAKELLRKNAKVYLACRNVEKGKRAVETIQNELKSESSETLIIGESLVLELDLSDLASVKQASTEILVKEKRVDILINNAGVMLAPFELLTKQGYDLQFGTNVLGHYYFTILLLPALERSTIYHKEKARVINVSSVIHTLASPGETGIDWKVLEGGEDRMKAIENLGFPNNWNLYGVSKMGNVLMSNFLTRDYGDKIVSCALNPGHIKTNIFRHMSSISQVLSNMVFHPPPLGAYTSLFAATVVPADEINGKFFQPWARIGRADPRASNVEVQEQLKQWLNEQVIAFEKR